MYSQYCMSFQIIEGYSGSASPTVISRGSNSGSMKHTTPSIKTFQSAPLSSSSGRTQNIQYRHNTSGTPKKYHRHYNNYYNNYYNDHYGNRRHWWSYWDYPLWNYWSPNYYYDFLDYPYYYPDTDPEYDITINTTNVPLTPTTTTTTTPVPEQKINAVTIVIVLLIMLVIMVGIVIVR